jgi:hypothetical protein
MVTFPISRFYMSRIETRITSVQIVPGFPARLTILDPPGWDGPPPQPSSGMRRCPDTWSEHTRYVPSCITLTVFSRPPSPQQIEDFGGNVCSSSDVDLPPAVGPTHTPGTPPQPTREIEAETPPTPKTEETRVLDGGPHMDNVSSEQSTSPFSTLWVSGACTVTYCS